MAKKYTEIKDEHLPGCLNGQRINTISEYLKREFGSKTIKLATGWERGKDGKWRHEIDDSGVEVHLDHTVYDGARPEYMSSTF